MLLPVSPLGKLSKAYRGSLCYFLERDANLQFSKIKVKFFKEQNVLFHQNLSAKSHRERKGTKLLDKVEEGVAHLLSLPFRLPHCSGNTSVEALGHLLDRMNSQFLSSLAFCGSDSGADG